MQKILYYILFGIWYVLSCLPACVHYTNSYILSGLLFHVIRYRRKMVHRNMKDSYPDLSDAELKKIERRFYLHFCDIFAESVMYFSMSRKETMRRMKFTNIEILFPPLEKGQSVALYLGHYANWEWVSSMPLWVPREKGLCTQLYHPLENPVFDKIISYTRERFGGKNIPVNESVRHMLKYKQEGTPILVGFIADQAPFWNNIHYWTNFLNHPDTPIFTGPERLMKKMDMAVYYVDVHQKKRGYYEATFVPMTDHPKDCKEYELTEQYTRMLEKSINDVPYLWLWSHNRWKRTKEQWLKMYDPKTGKVYMK